jgi:hypothetical protein
MNSKSDPDDKNLRQTEKQDWAGSKNISRKNPKNPNVVWRLKENVKDVCVFGNGEVISDWARALLMEWWGIPPTWVGVYVQGM